MGIQQTSSELASRIVALSQIEHDASLSAADKAQKLKSMKAETIEKINAEIPNVTIAAKAILNNIRTIVENEEWAKLPPPRKLSNAIDLNNSVALALQSIDRNATPDIQQLMGFYLDIMKRWLQTMANTEMYATERQWEAIHEQKMNAKDAAEQEKQSGIISGAVGIATSIASIAVKGVVMGVSSVKFNQAKLTNKDHKAKFSEMTARNEALHDNIEAGKIKAKTARTDIAAQEIELSKRKAAPLGAGETRTARQAEIAYREKVIDQQKNALKLKEDGLAVNQKEVEMLSTRVASHTSVIDAANNKAARVVQQWKALDEIFGQVFGLAQQGGNIAKAFSDKKAADLKIDSDMSSFMVNLFGTMTQTARKDAQDIVEAKKSIMSTVQATVQTQTAAESYSIKT